MAGETSTSITAAEIESHLQDLRTAFQADGADLHVAEVDGSQVTLDLVVTEETCVDCIVPPPLLADMVADAITSAMPSVASVVVNDPRV